MGIHQKKSVRWILLVLVASCWMSMGVLSDCDPAIAGNVLSGVGDATASVVGVLIQAGFDAIAPEQHTPVTTST